VSAETKKELDVIFSELTAEARRVLKEDGFSDTDSLIQRELEIRYKGQSYELTVPYDQNFLSHFHKKHHLLYSYFLKDEDCEIVNLRVMAIGKTKKLSLKKRRLSNGTPPFFNQKKIYLNGKMQSFYLYQRKDCLPGQFLEVPAIVVSDDSTIVVEKSFQARVDEYSNLVLERKHWEQR
jgi:N-methylhydantoinase A